jgi:5-hydroxyisourate hydrolase-like protein (transthyretin family)
MSPDTTSSSRQVLRPAMRLTAALLLACGLYALLGTAIAPRVGAQARGTAPSGVELAFSGPSVVVRGRPMHHRGVAYRVRGLATLEPFPAAVVHARYRWGVDHGMTGPTVDVRADARGRFELDITAPSTWDESLELQIEIDDGDESRTFEMPMSDRSPYALLARTDRVLYEPSEPVHVWTLVRDARSQRPLAGEHVRLEVTNGPLAGSVSEVTTAADGVASATFTLPEEASEGTFTVRVQVGDEVTQLHPRVGTRTYSRLFARVTTEPELAAPGATVVAVVEATTPSGAPVRDAWVTLVIDRQTEITGVTDEAGVARIPFTAPSYMPSDTSAIGVGATVHHAAHGEIFAHATLRLAVPMAPSMMATSRIARARGGRHVLLDRDRRRGEPPSSSVEIEVVGPSVRGGRATVRTDAAGIAQVPARLPAGTWAPGSGGDGTDGRPTSVLATIHGPLERTARLSIAVQPEAVVLPIVQSPIVQPGSRVEVRIERRASVQRAELVAELLDGSEIVAVRRLGAGESRLSFDVPVDRIGSLTVRVRSLEGDQRAEGLGTLDSFLALPAQLGFPTLSPDRPRYLVGETARLDVSTSPAPQDVRTFAAVMVRDLAAHDGEVPFSSFFLERAFEQAVLAPTPTGMSVVRVALAARSVADEAGGEVPTLLDPLGLPRGEEYDGTVGADVLRDPFPWARELERRGIADVMRTVEELLVEALANDALDEVTTGTGAQRRFEDDLLADLGGATLGGGALTIAHLEAADPSFRYETVARRVARTRWVHLSSRLAMYLDPGDDAPVSARMAAREPSDRWLPRMVEAGLIDASDLKDPWGNQFVLARVARPTFALSTHAMGLELVSPGPDGRPGTADDVRDPFARVVPAGTPYAVASGEDELLRRLSLISPYERTLQELGEAYARITAEMTEELIGDAVHAGVSEGALGLGSIGTIGHGSGSGYGGGGGGFRGRSARAPSIRAASAAQYAFRGLAVVMRERFPATLLFRPSVELDASGHASVEVRLADAVTSYVVEAIVWRTDGWIWSAETRIEADREIVVEAPIPEVARTDDAIALPVRVGNRGRGARTLVVSVLEAEEIGLAASEPRTITVGAGDAVVETFVVHLTREAHGHVRVAVGTPEGDALDAIRLPIEVVARTRRVRRTVEMLSLGRGVIALEVPADATMRTGLVEVHVGKGLIAPSGSRVLQHWAHAAGAPRLASDPLDATSESELAWRVGVRWTSDSVDDRLMSEAIDRLSRTLDQAVGEGTEPTGRTARSRGCCSRSHRRCSRKMR